MSYEFQGFVQQGWQCPVCGAIYSPTIPMCWNCTGKRQTVVYSDRTAPDVTRTPEDILRRRFCRLEGNKNAAE